jgi:hypothetical protein
MDNLDTISKVKRKDAFEKQLKQLEKDIIILSRENIIIDTSM